MKSKFARLARLASSSNAKAVGTAVLLSLPAAAFAQFNVPIIDGVGCDIVNWMRGPLSILVFLIVAVSTFVIGLFAKMDWTKILTIIILYGLLQGLAGILLASGTITLPSCFN